MSKHVCFIIPSIGVGGAERVVSILANYLVSNDYGVTIICLVNDVSYSLDKRVSIIFPKFNLSRNLPTLFRVIKFYRQSIRKIKPDVILSFLEFYNEIAMFSLLGIKKKIYLFDRSNPYLKDQNFIQAFLKKYLYPKANGVIVQTERALEFVKQNKLNHNTLVLPNPISQITKDWNPASNKIITCVGRMEAQKNQKYLIKVFSELPNEEWVLQFVGDGSLRNELEEYAKSLNLEDKVTFLGTRKDVQNILSESTIFAFPSLWEGFPNALLEAMAVGVPCISNNCPTGPAEIIQDGVNGFLVEIGDSKEFIDKLSQLMSNSQIRNQMSQEGRKIKSIYSIEVIVKKLENFLFNCA